jgi:uncharacterized RDD family membrane protein YckC
MKATMVLGISLVLSIAGAYGQDYGNQDQSIVGRALASRIVDYGLVFGASAGIQTLMSVTLGVPSIDWFVDRSWLLSIWAVSTMSIPMWIYNTSLVASSRQSTLGHRLSGVAVAVIDGQRVSFGRSLLRSAFMFLGWELAHMAMFIPRNFVLEDAAPWQYAGLVAATAYLVADVVAVIATGGRQSIADLVAGTRLVRRLP